MTPRLCEIRHGDACDQTERYLVRLREGSVRVCSDHAEDAFALAVEILPLDPAPCCASALAELEPMLCEGCGRALCPRHADGDREAPTCPLCTLDAPVATAALLEMRPTSSATVPHHEHSTGEIVTFDLSPPTPDRSTRERPTGEGGRITTGGACNPRLGLPLILAKLGGHICARARKRRGELCAACRIRRIGRARVVCDSCASRTIATAGNDLVEGER